MNGIIVLTEVMKMVFVSAMKFIADFHIHSKFSRATSRSLDPEHLALWAQKKGIAVLGTGDFTHPGWISELQEKLEPGPNGLYRLKPSLQAEVHKEVAPSCQDPVRFVLTGEISCIYKKGGQTRKLHHLILMPDMESVLRLNRRLDRIGNIASDGRPILGLDSKDLLEITLEASEDAFFIPAHIWTPWFSLFGSKSGFDTIAACFEDLTDHIHALETGLSSDPPMNRLLSDLDRYILVSNSDAHSPAKLGREANIFDTEPDYFHMVQAMTHGKGFGGTIEFFPEEGKYHLDGHRKCGIHLAPEESEKAHGICPSCGRPMTIGVLNRVHQLSDRKLPSLRRPFFSLIPLPEILAELLGCGPATKRVTGLYHQLLEDLGPELPILMDTPLPAVRDKAGPILAEALKRMRAGEVIREGGYDGQFGTIRLFEAREKASIAGQMSLFMNPAGTAAKPKPRLAPGRGKAPGNPKRKPGSAVNNPPADPLLDPLNQDQRAAVLHRNGHLLVVAGPGTGKTLTLTHRIAHLVRSQDTSPHHILALTFTRKAAQEMTNRIASLLGGPECHRIKTTTFHHFCLELLRREGTRTGLPPDFTVCSEPDTREIAAQILQASGKGKRELKAFLKDLPGLKARLLLEENSNSPCARRQLEWCQGYQQVLRQGGMLDLDDLEIESVRLLRDHPDVAEALGRQFSRILVDEYQDTNPRQVSLLKHLIAAGKGQIYAIGDADQAIYGFRGADVRHFRHFARDFPGATRIKLTRNYRSTPIILKSSAALMGKKQPLTSHATGGEPIAIAHLATVDEEAEMIVAHMERLMGGISHFSMDSGRVDGHAQDLGLGFGDMGVLYRLNVQGNALEKALSRAGIPFVRSGHAPLIEQYPVNLLWRFFQTLRYPRNPYYRTAYTRLGLEARRNPPGTLEVKGSVSHLLDQAIALHALTPQSEQEARMLGRLRDVADQCGEDVARFLDILSLERGLDHAMVEGDRVALMSLHAAKGLEWEVTFIIGCEEGLLPCSLFKDQDEAEERRLFYVGMTRARSRLILSHVDRRSIKGPLRPMTRSVFLDAISPQWVRPLDRGHWRPQKRGHRQLTLF
ncbi:MAG: UvrD-helicase domain-containing protein [Deltaproteobacteria bacterium]|nr:UvrD-helicase domain-containing protein [Deltaproteobacteria bacterium]